MRPPPCGLGAWALRRPSGDSCLATWKPGPWPPGRRPPGTCGRTACPGRGPSCAPGAPWWPDPVAGGRELQAVAVDLVRARNSPSCSNRAREPAPGLGPGPLTWPPGRRPGGRILARAARPGGRQAVALVRDPWAVGRGPGRPGPGGRRPGARAARPGACYLVRDPWPVALVPVALARATWCAPWWPGPRPGASPGGRSARAARPATPAPRFEARVRSAKALARFRTVN
jgi:hypothetical protein